jgi:hypothetical protein
MISKRTIALVVVWCSAVLGTLTHASSLQAQEPPQSAAPTAVMKAVGTVKAINGNSVTLTTDSGSETTVLVQDSTHMLRTAPGEKDLKGAAAMHLQDLQIGDRMLVRGTAAADGKSVLAVLTLIMTKADVSAKQAQEREDWQKRGVGGLVKAIDAASGTITLSTSAMGVNKTVAVHVDQSNDKDQDKAKATVIRRYAPDSVKFDDAKPGSLHQIKPGDQLRARGDRSADGSELAAQEIVSGTFQNIAGTVVSSDPGGNTVRVMDLITKKPITLKIAPDSQMHKLPPEAAQRIAARLKGDSTGANLGGNAPGAAPPGGASPAGSPLAVGGNASSARAGAPTAGNGGGLRSGGGDIQQMLSHMPAVALTDLQKGDAVMIVATEGSANSEPTAITLLTGVDPILSAAPNSGQAAMLLSPWNLGGGGGDAGP